VTHDSVAALPGRRDYDSAFNKYRHRRDLTRRCAQQQAIGFIRPGSQFLVLKRETRVVARASEARTPANRRGSVVS
jgi:hypothetical protein